MLHAHRSATFLLAATLATASLVVAASPASAKKHGPRISAVAVLNALGDSGVAGKVTFTDTGAGVKVVAEITGLSPGDHGFHVHDKGDCSAPDGTSAGPHFNPTEAPHGGPLSVEHHCGDFGNITASAKGVAKLTVLSSHIKLDDSASSVIGRSVILHANPDDMKSQPAGNAGPRIACGVVTLIEDGSKKAAKKSGY